MHIITLNLFKMNGFLWKHGWSKLTQELKDWKQTKNHRSVESCQRHTDQEMPALSATGVNSFLFHTN